MSGPEPGSAAGGRAADDPFPVGIAAALAATPHKPALVSGPVTWTFATLDAWGRRLAARLGAQGAARGGRVAIMLANGPQFFGAWYAAAVLEGQAVLVNRHLVPEELAYILEDSGASVLVTSPELAGVADAARGGDAAWATVVLEPSDGPGVLEAGVVDVVDGRGASGAPGASGAAAVPVAALAPPVFYTSGTTGRPKGVVHGTFGGDVAVAATAAQASMWGWTADDVNLLCGPAYHAGPGGYVMTALFVGATSVLLERWDPRAWLEAVDRRRVTVCFMTPAHFIRILEVPAAERAGYDLSSLRLIVHGAAPCPISVKERFMDLVGPDVVWELYGASEGGATRVSAEQWRSHPGSVGLPWPGVDIRVLDPDGHPCPTGVEGVVYIRPPGGMRFHYHDDPERTAAAWRDDAFTVGDVGRLDEDGFLYLTDRATDMVIRGGVNVYPREVEDVLHRHPAVVDCAVFGVPDERDGEALLALVEVRADARDATTAEALRAFCAEHLARFKVPSRVEFVDELPREPNGKVLKRRLRAPYWEGRERRIG